MKFLCVYDPSLIFIPNEQGGLLRDAVMAFDEHNTAQDFFGFKAAISDIVEIALLTVDQAVLASAEIILNSILQRLANSRSDFYFVAETPETPFKAQQGDSLFANYVDKETVGIWRDLIGGCFETGLCVCYASWFGENDLGEQAVFKDDSGRQLSVSRDRYEWGEAYRQLRGHPANLLPNTFIRISTDGSIFAFCPPVGVCEDEQDLPRPRLPQGMLKQGKWRQIGGNRRGYRDRWDNYWMWNQNRWHWDVQITEPMRRALDATDYHLNVECAGAIAPSDGTLLEGRIIEGFKPDPNIITRFSIWELP